MTVITYYKPFLCAHIYLHQLCEVHSIRTSETGQQSRRGLEHKYKTM